MPDFPDLCREPDAVFLVAEGDSSPKRASKAGGEGWACAGSRIGIRGDCADELSIVIESVLPLRRVYLRWRHDFLEGMRFLGDAWERSYGDLEWRIASPNRAMPWYFLAANSSGTSGYGVMTGPACIAVWTVDQNGVTLELDTRSGGVGVKLGSRLLHACTVRQRLPRQNETPHEAARALCARLCRKPLFPAEPVVGHNDWYWLYGRNSARQILEATQRMVDLYPGEGDIRPWSVVDDGWQSSEQAVPGGCNGGPWTCGNASFRDMAGLAGRIVELGARPGIWMRPLLTAAQPPDHWLLHSPRPSDAAAGHVLDPSHPEVIHQVKEDVGRLREWGYALIKHDFSTFDVTGRWGAEMNTRADGFSGGDWRFHDRSRTTAEILLGLYRAIREAAGAGTLIMGCNAVGHLGAGLMELQRIGDDTSADDWNRTRRMGVNALAFRVPQHRTFFAIDADCVPVSPHIQERLTMSWLDLVARSGTPLFVSMDPAALTPTMKKALQKAFIAALTPSPEAEALDWQDATIPCRWLLQGKTKHYLWNELDSPLDSSLMDTAAAREPSLAES